MKSNIKWALFFAVLCAVCAALWFSRPVKIGDTKTAKIIKDGLVIREIDLSEINTPYEFEISDEYGANTIRAEHNRIAVISADCPDKICVSQGYIEDGKEPIVCLPHRLVIEVYGSDSDGVDAVSGGK